MLDFETYQTQASKTASYPAVGVAVQKDALTTINWLGVIYPALGLVGEAGEFANKVKKIIRDHQNVASPEMVKALSDELGDVLWYVAECCTALGLDLYGVALNNSLKLQRRQREGKIHGSGDDR